MRSSILSMKKIKGEQGQIIVICGLSNGDVVILKATSDAIKIVRELRYVHEFGVNALDAIALANDKVLVVSGGDD